VGSFTIGALKNKRYYLMKKLLLTLILVFHAMSAMAMQEDPIETGFFNNKAIYGFDTVAYFSQNKAVKGKDEITSKWRGAIWYFSTQENKRLFESNPEQYAPQYGGYCAYAMAQGKFVGIDEDAFSIIEGKLYLNYSKSVQEDWLATVDKFIQQADTQYPANVDL
jgi:YHS domain-containing protein